MNYKNLEQEIVDRLNSWFTANNLSDVFVARLLPENANDLNTLPENQQVVNVHYGDSVYASPNSTTIIVQNETIKVMCFLQLTNLKEENGGYDFLNAVKSCLLGYRPTDSRTRMWISSYGDWQSEESGQMWPFLEFSFDTINQQSFCEDDEYVVNPLNQFQILP